MQPNYDELSQKIAVVATEIKFILKLGEEQKDQIKDLYLSRNDHADRLSLIQNQLILTEKLNDVLPDLLDLLKTINEKNLEEVEEIQGNLKQGIPSIRHMLYELTDRDQKGDKFPFSVILKNNIKKRAEDLISYGAFLVTILLILKALGPSIVNWLLKF